LAERAEREAAGESFWTNDFSERARTRIHHAVLRAGGDAAVSYLRVARQLILDDEGIHYLIDPSSRDSDYLLYLARCESDMMPTAIEAFYEALQDEYIYRNLFRSEWDSFAADVNEILSEERISYELIEGQMTPFSSRELHVKVVAPVLRLIHRSGWELVESAYQDALGELASGNAPDAITDAGTALQEALTKLGATGNALGPLISSAQRAGLIGPHDQPILEVVARACTWVSADRSQLGDAHNVTQARIEDAWLCVHIVGAVILRLATETVRGSARA